MKHRAQLSKTLKSLGLGLILSAPTSFAMPPDLVQYNENEEGYLYRVEKSPTGEDQLVSYLCPKNVWVKQVSDCGTQAIFIMPMSNFRMHVKSVLTEWSKNNPMKDLPPLKAKEIHDFVHARDISLIQAELDGVKNELAPVETMLQNLPSSLVYQKLKAEKLLKISTLENQIRVNIPVQKVVTDLVDSITKLIISNNPETGALNFYARSQMEGQLLHIVINSFNGANGSLDISGLTLKYMPKGSIGEIRIAQEYFQLWTSNVFRGNYSSQSPSDCANLLKIVRQLQSEGKW